MKKYFLVFFILTSYELAFSQFVFRKSFELLCFSGQQTFDGGFVFCGTNYYSSFNDVVLAKTNSNGDNVWTKTYGGGNSDWGQVVRETSDHGFIIAGGSQSFGSGFEDDLYLIKTDSAGNLLWSEAYGDSHYESVLSIEQTNDGGYILAGNISVGATGLKDIHVIKLDSAGVVLWTRIMGGANEDYANEIQETTDNGFIVGGYTLSFGSGNKDALMFKLDSLGII
ncbi:MAG: hypothetical protein M3R27_00485 [Bacteroidota bacterium]|nr:hypothetical protein [Bacteroidota bacterium]